MFSEANYANDSVNVLEERELLQQMVSLGVGYPYERSWLSGAAISSIDILYKCISHMINLREYLGVNSVIRDAIKCIPNGNYGYYLIDLYEGCMFSREQHPIEDIIIDFTISGTNDRLLFRRKKGDRLHGTGFLIVPDAVYFLGVNRACIPLSEFHMLSFISSDGNFRSGFVIDYDAAQSNRPLVLFPCEENSDIIQNQLDYDDHCRAVEFKSLIESTGFRWKNI